MIKAIFAIVLLFSIFLLSGCLSKEEKSQYGTCNAYERLAEEGEVSAMLNIAICYRTGIGRDKDIDKAISWYRLAADNNNFKAMNDLANIYLFEIKDQNHYSEARSLLIKSAASGSSLSNFSLALVYLNSLGVEPSLMDKAIDYFEKSANYKHEASTITLAIAYCLGEFGATKNSELCEKTKNSLSNDFGIKTREKFTKVIDEYLENKLFRDYLFTNTELIDKTKNKVIQ